MIAIIFAGSVLSSLVQNEAESVFLNVIYKVQRLLWPAVGFPLGSLSSRSSRRSRRVSCGRKSQAARYKDACTFNEL